jgi:hypothetical protein
MLEADDSPYTAEVCAVHMNQHADVQSICGNWSAPVDTSMHSDLPRKYDISRVILAEQKQTFSMNIIDF